MPATLTTLSEILKEVYEPQIQDQLNNETVTSKRIERSSEGVTSEVGGKYTTFPVHVRRNQGIGARNEMEALPTPGQQGYATARVRLAYLYGSARFSGQTLKLADSNYQAFASAMDEELNGLKNDLAKDANRQVYGDGHGTVAVASANGAGVNTVTVEWTGWLQDEMQVDLVDGTTLNNASPTIKASNRQITDINLSTNVVTLDGAVFSPAIGDVLVRTGSVNREWNGLQAIINDTSTFQDINPSVEKKWAAVIDSNGGTNRAVSEGLMTLMADRIRTNGGKVTAIFSNLGVRRAYANLLTQQRRFTNTTEFEGGFRGLAFTTDQGDIPFVVDTDCPPNEMNFVNEKALTIYREGDWAFMDEDGNKFFRVSGYDAYDVTMFQYSQLGAHRRNTHGKIADLTEG